MDIFKYASEKGGKRLAECSGNSVGSIRTLALGVLGVTELFALALESSIASLYRLDSLIIGFTVGSGSLAGVLFTFAVSVFGVDDCMFLNIKMFELWDDC